MQRIFVEKNIRIREKSKQYAVFFFHLKSIVACIKKKTTAMHSFTGPINSFRVSKNFYTYLFLQLTISNNLT